MSIVLLSWAMLFSVVQPVDVSPGQWRVYIGTYTGESSKGIYVLEFDPTSGRLSEPQLAVETENPSFLAKHPILPVIYACGEASEGGTVSAFRIDDSSGMLQLINRESSVGSGPCHVAVSPSGKHVAVANYGGGSVALLPLGEDGALEKASAFVQHEGSGPNLSRQKGPHAHAVYFDADGKYLYVADLGLDKLLIYDYDSDAGTLAPHDPPHAAVEPGAGPRHAAFHPSGKFAYVVNEMGNTVSVFAHDAARAVMTPLQTIGTLPAGFSESNTTAEIVAHPSGRFLYASNRGHDSIAVFTIDPQSGKLTATGHKSTGGKTPRNFEIDPSGNYLFAANQNSNTIHVFRIDGENGGLEPAGAHVNVGKPVCVLFVAGRNKS